MKSPVDEIFEAAKKGAEIAFLSSISAVMLGLAALAWKEVLA